MRPRFYHPSGRVPALTGLVLLCSLGCAGLGGFLYAWATLYGGVLLGIGLICAFPIWLVLIVKWACHLGKIRNPGLMRQFGFLLGLVAWAIQWILWIVLASYDSIASMPGQSLAKPIADLLADPAAFHQGLTTALVATDWFKEDHYMLLRYACWLCEFCLLLIPPGKTGFVHAGRPFCEALNRWATVAELPHLLAGETLLKARSYLAEHPAQLLAALTPVRGARDYYAKVTVYTGKCDSFISVVVHHLKFDGPHVTRDEHVIVEYLSVSARDLAAVLDRLSRPPRRKTKLRGKKTPRAKLKNQGQSQIVEQL